MLLASTNLPPSIQIKDQTGQQRRLYGGILYRTAVESVESNSIGTFPYFTPSSLLSLTGAELSYNERRTWQNGTALRSKRGFLTKTSSLCFFFSKNVCQGPHKWRHTLAPQQRQKRWHTSKTPGLKESDCRLHCGSLQGPGTSFGPTWPRTYNTAHLREFDEISGNSNTFVIHPLAGTRA